VLINSKRLEVLWIAISPSSPDAVIGNLGSWYGTRPVRAYLLRVILMVTFRPFD